MDNRLHEIEEGLERELGALLGSVNFSGYSDRARLRADDLAVRTYASQAVLDAKQRVLKAIATWNAENITEPTREDPFPPAETVAKLRSMHAFERRLAELENAIRGAAAPDLDAVWNQRTDGIQTLEALLNIDRALVKAANALATAEAFAEQPLIDLQSVLDQRRTLIRGTLS